MEDRINGGMFLLTFALVTGLCLALMMCDADMKRSRDGGHNERKAQATVLENIQE